MNNNNNNNINRKLESALAGMNKRDLQNLVRSAKNSGVLSRLSESDKKRIMDEFSRLDTNQIRQKLSKLNMNDFSRMNVNDIIKNLNNL